MNGSSYTPEHPQNESPRPCEKALTAIEDQKDTDGKTLFCVCSLETGRLQLSMGLTVCVLCLARQLISL